MAPLKFEDNIREKLEQRTIDPSQDSWERLSSELDKKNGQKKETKKIWWYGMAASLVGFLIIASFFYNQEEKGTDRLVVDSEKITEKKEKNIEIVENHQEEQEEFLEKKQFLEEAKQTISVVENSSVKTTKKRPKKLDEVVKNEKEVKQSQIVIAETEIKEAPELVKLGDIDQKEIEDKVASVIAQVEQMQQNDIKVTDDEIDRLLQNAQREITSERIIKSNKVNATALLQDVEAELDETFKERVFEALKAGFQKVKTAVAERNQ